MEALQRLHNRGSISTGYEIENSLKLETDNGEKLISSQFISAGNQKTWTVSFWVKITELGTNQMYWGSSDTYHYKGTDDKMYINFRGGSENFFLGTNRVFRDTSAWYHFVIVCDATNATNTDRGRLYINGVRETDYQLDTYNNMDGNDNTAWNGSNIHSVGGQNGSSTFNVSGYMAEFHSVDGQALDPTDFGEFDSDTGIWKPKEYTGSYGTNGFYLDFKNSLDLGDDVSGNSKAFTNTNITSADQATDTPTNNFCTWLSNGQLFHPTSAADNPTFNEGGTRQIGNGGTGWVYAYATQAASSGKWYYEGIVGSAKNCMIGACPVSTTSRPTNFYLGQESNSTVGFQYSDGNIFFYTGYTTWESGGLATGDIVGFAMDLDNGKAYVSRNGVWFDSANPATNYRGLTVGAMTQEPYMFAMARYNPNENNPFNFGGFTTISISTPETDENGYGNFEYAPPSGFYAMCTKNLEEFG